MSTLRDQAGQSIQSPGPNPPSGAPVQIIGNYGQKTDAIMVGPIAVPVKKD